MQWIIDLHPTFKIEFLELPESVQDQILKSARLLVDFGPSLGRPHADTLSGSKYTNMKELRFNAEGGVWRVAFAFAPDRKAILLVAGDKSGVSKARFYKHLIQKADIRFDEHLKILTGRS